MTAVEVQVEAEVDQLRIACRSSPALLPFLDLCNVSTLPLSSFEYGDHLMVKVREERTYGPTSSTDRDLLENLREKAACHGDPIVT